MVLKNGVKWESLKRHGDRHFFKDKEVIYKEGTYGSGFYYIEKGLINVLTNTVKGNERLLNLGFPGQTLGMQAIDQNHYATTAVAAKDSVLYFFRFEQITKLISNEPELLNLITDMIHHNSNILIQNVYLDTMSSAERLSFVLLTYQKELIKNKISLTVQDLVKYTGLSRVTVYRILRKWDEEGIISLKGREFTINKPELLEKKFSDKSVENDKMLQ